MVQLWLCPKLEVYATDSTDTQYDIAIYLVKKITGMSYPNLAKVFHKKNHTTMLSSYQLIQKKIDTEPAFALEMLNLEKEIGDRD